MKKRGWKKLEITDFLNEKEIIIPEKKIWKTTKIDTEHKPIKMKIKNSKSDSDRDWRKK